MRADARPGSRGLSAAAGPLRAGLAGYRVPRGRGQTPHSGQIPFGQCGTMPRSFWSSLAPMSALSGQSKKCPLRRWRRSGLLNSGGMDLDVPSKVDHEAVPPAAICFR